MSDIRSRLKRLEKEAAKGEKQDIRIQVVWTNNWPHGPASPDDVVITWGPDDGPLFERFLEAENEKSEG